MTVTAEPDEARRRIIITARPGTRWAGFQTFVRDCLQARSDLAGWNWVIDDQGPMDDVDVEDMAATGALFRKLAAGPPRQTFTIVVTTDRYFATWAQVIDLNYGGRKHLAAPTRAAAEALLDRLEATAASGED